MKCLPSCELAQILTLKTGGQKMTDLFRNKSVVLIGPAPHVIESSYDFRHYDIVCRINRMVPIPEEMKKATGDRCDVWFPANQLLRNEPSLCGLSCIKTIRCSQKASEIIPKDFRYKWSKSNILHDELSKAVGCLPNRGLKAMVDILKDQPTMLFIVGFTFYQGGAYYPGYTNDQDNERHKNNAGNIGRHVQEGQIRYFKEKILPSPNVWVDSVMMKMFC
jgi:hypothetical protein